MNRKNTIKLIIKKGNIIMGDWNTPGVSSTQIKCNGSTFGTNG